MDFTELIASFAERHGIAADPKFDLAKRGENAFGFAANAAMRFFGRNGQNSIFGTIFNVPPAKRRVLFAANDALAPLITDIGTAAPRVERGRRRNLPGLRV